MSKKGRVIEKIIESQLTGKGGACFSVADKWQMVKRAKGDDKYVICNASEGEPAVHKDYFLLDKYPENIIDGMKIAIDYFGAKKGIIYLNQSYYKKLKTRFEKIIKNSSIELFKKPHMAGYVGGEETSLLNTLEGGRIEPRLRPPYPPVSGFLGKPTLINNVETFYHVSKIFSGDYNHTRFFSVNGDCLWSGVYEFPENKSIKQILKDTENYPDYEFFVQVGGGASGIVLNSEQLDTQVVGSGSITVYSVLKHDPIALIKKWLSFFKEESCGQCTPCREGTYRLYELISKKEVNWQMISDILGAMSETSFCGLGCSVAIPIKSYVTNVLSKYPDNLIKIPTGAKKIICKCF